MLSRQVALAVLIAVAHARFNQEQIPIAAIGQVQGGAPGVSQTIAGAAISDLLAGANACDKLRRGDQILAELGTGADSIAAAIGIVAAEKNFNPFAQDIPTICSDPTLPTNELLRGITPLIDPAVGGSAEANALSAQTVANPLDATGKSVADLLAENGFANFTSQDSAGATTPPAAGAGNAGAGNGAGAGAGAGAGGAASGTTAASTQVAAVTECGAVATSAAASTTAAAQQTATTTTSAAGNGATGGAGNGAGNGTGNGAGAGAGNGGAVDFGLCVPTMKFEGGIGNRPDTEFTFLPIDPLCAQGQQEALNPNIITNRICDQLTNVCESNAAAKALCKDAQAQILALGTRDKSTADQWNTLLGFPGTVTNPDGGPAEPPAKMRVVRSFRSLFA